MKEKNSITALVLLIAFLSALTSALGIFSDDGPGLYTYQSIRGETINIYGKGLYKHMSEDVAIQGIAQDYVTLFIAIPLLLLSLYGYRKNAIRKKFLLGGTLGYFFVSFLFYTAMGMYNIMFLAYIALLALSFFGLIMILLSFDLTKITEYFLRKTPVKFLGFFLIVNALLVAFLWLGIIIPPLLDGSVYPPELQHYTTLIVQGFDLGLLLPLAFVSGLLLIKKKAMGYLSAGIYFVFLSILMTALTVKIIAMAMHGVDVFPVIFIIPLINLISILCCILMINNIHKPVPDETA
jgi:hypothetical protein